MKIFSFLFFFTASIGAYGADLTGVSVGGYAPDPAFTKCVAQAAVEQVLHKFSGGFYQNSTLWGIWSEVQIFSNSVPATAVSFGMQAGTWDTRNFYSVVVHSKDLSSGWQILIGTSGAKYAYSNLVDSTAELRLDPIDNRILGSFDISNCK